MRRLLLALLLSCLLAACRDGSGADFVFTNGGVYSVDRGRSWAQAVAVEDGRIVFVGSNDDATRFVGPGTEVIDLSGKMLLPGLHDSHVHPILGTVLEGFCRLDDAETAEEVLAAAAECASSTSGDWVIGFGWRSSIFLPDIAPRKQDLDRIVPDRPAVLVAKDMHTFWLNTPALDAVGITKGSPTPAGGEIVRDAATGEPSGALRDFALDPVVAAMPAPGLIATLRGLRATIGEMNRYGYTSFMEARLEDSTMAWAYRLLELTGMLDARVSLAVLLDPRLGNAQFDEIRRLREDFSTKRIDARIVKIFVDGGTAVRSAASGPYEGGVPSAELYIDAATLSGYVTELDNAGFAVHLHTLGDAATRAALDAIAEARSANPASGLRHAITHLVYPAPDDLDRFRPLDVIANISPSWAYPNEWSASFPPVLGEVRSEWMYPFRTLAENGVRLSAGSDYPFTPLNPFVAIEVGMTRRDPDGLMPQVLVGGQALALEELLAAYTIDAAYQLHQDRITGSIETGKAADLVVVDRNLFATTPDMISETQVLLTMLEGGVVYRAGD